MKNFTANYNPSDDLAAFYAWRTREANALAARMAPFAEEAARKLASVVANARMPAPRVVIVPVEAL